MIDIKRISDVKYDNYDEVWAIVRSLKTKSSKLKQVTALSPSLDLFFKYRNLVKSNNWSKKSFDEIYVPQFLKELKSGNEKGFEFLNELYRLDKAGKKICLVCFCTEESMCHRSIVAGLLQGAGCNVRTEKGTDYSKYYAMYKACAI